MFSFFKKKSQDPAASTTITPAATPAPSAPPPLPKKSWLASLRSGLSRTSSSITTLFVGAKIDDDLFDELESALLMADAGVEATEFLLEGLKKKVKADKLTEASEVKAALRNLLLELLSPLEKPLMLGREQPLVIMIAGVNGAGKTTTIGKMAHRLSSLGQKVIIGAGDTFRAAAVEQLAVWADRAGADIVRQSPGADPGAVAFDAVAAGQARNADVVIIDTAGRLQTQHNLMEELRKVYGVTGKAMEGAPHHVLLVIDSTTGQNGVSQARLFSEAVPVSGLVLTKLDGVARGGIVVAIHRELGIPVTLVGVGEAVEDLQPFDARAFAEAIFSADTDAGQ